MKKINIESVRLLFIVFITGFLFAFASHRSDRRYLKKTEVIFSGRDNLIMSSSVVNKLLIENNLSVKSIRKEKVDLNRLEKALDSHKMVEKSEVFLSIDGTLTAVVKQKTPVARAFNDTGSYYIDHRGSQMPLSTHFSARVPLVTGHVHKGNISKLTNVLKVIYNDAYLKKNIISVHVYTNGYMRMKNRCHDYLIDFGSEYNAVEKFKNYKAFLQKTRQDNLASKYKVINLKYANQVVCTK